MKPGQLALAVHGVKGESWYCTGVAADVNGRWIETWSAMMESSLLRVNDVAQLLRVSKWTIYRWIEEGRLGATKIGHGSLRVFQESVTALVEANRMDPPPVTRSVPRKVAAVRAAGQNKRG